MVVIKTEMSKLPKVCEDCSYYGVHPTPFDRWKEVCELCGEMLNHIGGGWYHNGKKRPDNCPLVEVSDDK